VLSGLWVLVLGAFAFSPSLAAQLPSYNVPDDPAFIFLGVSPKRIANPGTLPALGLALADGIDPQGRVNAGVAISFLPSNLFRYTLTPEQYRNGHPRFWFYNTQISVATVRKSGDTAATDLAFGVRTILLGPEPYADPAFRTRMAGVLDYCLTQALGVDTTTVVIQQRTGVRPAPVRDSAKPPRIVRPSDGVPGAQDTVRMWKVGPSTIDREIAVECAERGKARALKAWMKDHWNDATVALSAAGGTRFDESAIQARAALGTSLWLVAAVPIRWTKAKGEGVDRVNVGQLAAQLHYIAPPGQAGTVQYNYWESGIRALAGKSTVNGFIELTRNLSRSPVRQDRRAWATGVEYMFAESIWLAAGVGERYAELLDNDKDFVFLNLKWGLARESRLSR
jgi:hypothetical protein